MRTRFIPLVLAATLLVPTLASASSQSYSSSGTFTAPIGGVVTIQATGGGGGGGGGTWDDGYAGGRGGAGAPTTVSGSFGTVSAPGGAGGAGQPTGQYMGGPGGWGGEEGNGGALVVRSVTLTEGETLTISIGGGGGGGGGGGVSGYGPAGSSGSAGTVLGGAGGIGGSSCTRSWTSGHSGPAASGGSGGVSSGGGGGGGAAADNGSFGCAKGSDGGAGSLSQGGASGMAYRYTYLPPAKAGGVAPGGGGLGGNYGGDAGSGGAAGEVTISWNVPAPTCSITFDQNPLTGASTVMHWTSSNATLFYINNVGYVSGSGSATVFSTGDYSGTVSGAGGSATCAGVLSGNNDQCTASSSTCGADGNLHDSCGHSVSCQYGCSTTTNQCRTSCTTLLVCDATGKKVVNACDGSTVENCADRGAGWVCSAGACVLPSVSFESFDADWEGTAFTATGHLQGKPALLRAGQTARLYWSAKNASSCTVSGTNGDNWTGFSSGATGKLSRPIMQSTTYTLHCNALAGASPAAVDETVVLNVAPIFIEQ